MPLHGRARRGIVIAFARSVLLGAEERRVGLARRRVGVGVDVVRLAHARAHERAAVGAQRGRGAQDGRVVCPVGLGAPGRGDGGAGWDGGLLLLGLWVGGILDLGLC